jgi:protein TonB
VTVKFTVTREGRVRNPRVVAAEPPGVFEGAALAAIERWRFKPQAADFPGVTQKIHFNLREDG